METFLRVLASIAVIMAALNALVGHYDVAAMCWGGAIYARMVATDAPCPTSTVRTGVSE